MTKDEARSIGPNGLYQLFWKEGGSSLAAVGCLHNGDRWFAPTNWVASEVDGIGSRNWGAVAWVEPVTNDGIALEAKESPDGLVDALAEAIRDGRLSLTVGVKR